MRFGLFPVMLGREAAGPETYERHLLASLAAIDHDTEYHLWCLSQQAADAAGALPPNFVRHVLWPKTRWISMAASLPLAVKRSGVQGLHATFTPPPVCSTDFVFTMHGAVTFTHPQFYSKRVLARLNPLLRRGLQRARVTLCVSEFVRQEMMDLFGLSPRQLVTVYHGVDPSFCPRPAAEVAQQLLQTHGLQAPYVVYVGKLHANKNIVRLIEAFDLATRQQPEIELVLVGRMVYGCDGIDEAVQRLGLGQRVRKLGHQPAERLPDLYRGALCKVFPTIWEGFGLPVLEAMACGTPVVTSNVACMPEITAGAALLVNPLSSEAIAEALATVLSSAQKRAELRQLGLARAAHFSWEQTARQTLQAYRQIVQA
jgi:glycosyltransferase involved in cell wall biosynthesis